MTCWYSNNRYKGSKGHCLGQQPTHWFPAVLSSSSFFPMFSQTRCYVAECSKGVHSCPQLAGLKCSQCVLPIKYNIFLFKNCKMSCLSSIVHQKTYPEGRASNTHIHFFPFPQVHCDSMKKDTLNSISEMLSSSVVEYRASHLFGTDSSRDRSFGLIDWRRLFRPRNCRRK